jgi:beta-1,4-mannosyltransferase
MLKVLWLCFEILSTLLVTIRWPTHLLIQVPPAIPALLIAHLVCALRGSRLVVDWHNFGYTILALKLGAAHPFVRLSAWYERVLSRGAHASLAVTVAMTDFLGTWGVPAVVLHDNPPSHFRRLPVDEAHDLFRSLGKQGLLAALPDQATCDDDCTPWTRPVAGSSSPTRHEWRPDRPALVVSSTSWTPDEVGPKRRKRCGGSILL